jgi:hypothetical protein
MESFRLNSKAVLCEYNIDVATLQYWIKKISAIILYPKN